MTIVVTTLTRVLALAASFLVLMVSARFFGAAGRGVVAAAVSLATLVGTLGCLSIGRAILFRIVEEAAGPLAFHKRTLTAILGLFLVLSCAAALAAWAVIRLHPPLAGGVRGPFLLLALLMVPYFAWAQIGGQLFASLDLLMPQNVLLLVNRVLLLLVAAGLLHGPGLTLEQFVVVLTVFNLGGVVVECLALLRAVQPEWRIDMVAGRRLTLAGMQLHIDTIGGYGIASANVLVLNYFLPSRDVGVYEMAWTLVSAMAILPSVVQLRINTAIARLGVDGAWPHQRRLIRGTILVMTIGALLSMFLVPPGLRWFGRGYDAAIPLFPLLLLTLPGNTLALLMGPQWIGRGYLRTASALTVVTGALGLVLSVVLVPRFGVKGAVWSSVFVYGVALVLNGFFYEFVLRRVAARRAPQPGPEPA